MKNELTFDDYLHGHCDEWALENYKSGDKFFVITDYDWDIEDYALLHCGIYRNKKFIDIRGTFNNINILLKDEFDYSEEMDLQILTLKQFKIFCKNNNLLEQHMNKNLKQDLYNNIMRNISVVVKQQINENFNNTNTLQEVYENLGRQLLKDLHLNEGLSDTINNAVSKLKDKAEKLKTTGKNLANKMSGACKNAIETIKKEAGDAWEKIKDTYTSLVSIIDNALLNSSGFVKTLSDKFNLHVDFLESYIAQGYFEILSADLPVVPLVVDYLVNMPKSNSLVIAINMLLIAVPLLSSQCHFDLSMITDLLKTMKFTKAYVGTETSASF